MRKLALKAAVGAAIGLVPAGCATIGLMTTPTLGAPGYVYQAGRASQGFSFPMTQVQTALLEAMADLGVNNVHQTHEAQYVSFEGRSLDGRRAHVLVESQGTMPVVSVKFGLLGDEPLSKALLDRVGIRLGTLPPEAIPVDPPSAPAEKSLFVRPKARDPRMLPVDGDVGYRDSPVP